MKLNEKLIKNIEKGIGLPVDMIRGIDPRHMSFYLQNRDKVCVERDNFGEIYFVFNDKKMIGDYQRLVNHYETFEGNPVNGGMPLSEKFLDAYLDAIGFFGPKIDSEFRIDGIPSSRFLSSKQINDDFNKAFD